MNTSTLERKKAETMLSRILVPLDGSARAEQALSEAAHLARATQGSLILVRAVAGPPLYPATYVPVESVPNTTYDTLEEEANRYLTRVSQSNAVSGIPIEWHTVDGAAAPKILDAAEEFYADLILMCSHGRTGPARWVLGSVAQQVVRHAAVPVLVLRQRGTPEAAGGAGSAGVNVRQSPPPGSVSSAAARLPVRVVVPLDGSTIAEAALEPAVELGRALAATGIDTGGQGSAAVALHLLLVVSPYYAVPDNQPFTLLVDGARAYLAHMAEQLSSTHRGVSVTWRVAVADDVAMAIVRVAEHGESAAGPHGERLEGVGTDVGEGSSFIVIATHGRTGLERWAMGSIAERVVGTTSLPLLTVRPRSVDTRGEALVQSTINE